MLRASCCAMACDVLIVDNEAPMAHMLAQQLDAEGYTTVVAVGGEEAFSALEEQPFSVVITDLFMEPVDGLAVLSTAQRLHPATRVILMTAFGTRENAVAALREGAYDYLAKPFGKADLLNAVRRALESYRLGEENRRLRETVERHEGFQGLLGVSAAMQRLKEHIRDIARSDAAVLLIGESGTGKELAARAVHWRSARRHGAFVAVNCAAIPEGLLESELFGHERGAFTGAVQATRGLFRDADGGTIFLDEIGDMPLPLQAKLLRVLQEKMVRPVGARTEFRVDVRVITATNRDLAALVRRKRFREDLYYRVAVIPIDVPALRERSEDIPLLARHFVDRSARRLGKTFDGITDRAQAWLQAQRWPGNVRELENLLERAVTLARGRVLDVVDLQMRPAPLAPGDADVRPTLAELEHSYLERVLAETKGDKRAAARILGVSVRTIQRKTPPPPRWMPEAS
jgi:DNA-binding NtrC family response regulator